MFVTDSEREIVKKKLSKEKPQKWMLLTFIFADKVLQYLQNQFERIWGRLKNYIRTAMHYDKSAISFLAFISSDTFLLSR